MKTVGMVKQPTAEQSEFTMSSEDFPALPGTQITDGSLVVNSLGGHDGADKGSGGAAGAGMDLQTETVSPNDKAFKRGVQTSPNGKFYFIFSQYCQCLTTVRSVYCRKSHKHTCKYGKQSIRNGWFADVYSRCRIRPKPSHTSDGPGSYGSRPKFEFSR